MNIVDIIKKAVCDATGADEAEIYARYRGQSAVAARIIIAKLLRDYTALGEFEIADVLGKDHSTVAYYKKEFDNRFSLDAKFVLMYHRADDAVKTTIEHENKESRTLIRRM